MASPASILILRNASVLDVRENQILPGRHLLLEGGRIREVSDRPLRSAAANEIDLRGRTLMPGLCDAHVHVTAVTADFAALRHLSPSYVAVRAQTIVHGMLMRGFTTVRDAGGADYGLAAAVEEGLVAGPRLLFCGHAISQTGGHGDMRQRGQHELDDCLCCAGLGRVCDGVPEIRRTVRDEVRKGAHQIKLMVSGGVSSPTDRISSTQFSIDEITAAVEEAEAASLYVMGHAYTARAINRALRCGVRSIEHGNLMDEESAGLFVERKAFLVPTLSAYRTLAKFGIEAGLPKELHAKVFDVLDAGMRALELAERRGVSLVYGTDLLGILHEHQSLEFSIRSEVQTPAAVIRSATLTAARLFQMEGEIGVVEPGARADLLVIDGDPLGDLGLLQDQGRHIRAILKDGRFFKNELG
jgi:imidazolonepropionase-like amidohydrolase